MMKGISIFRRDGVLPVTIAVVASMLFVVMSTSAATTISTDITTGGAVYATGTLQATGAVITYGAGTFGDAAGDFQIFGGQLQASSTALFGGAVTVYGAATFGDAAADYQIFVGQLQASSTALFGGAVTTYGNATLGDAVGDSVTANAYFTQLRIGTGTTFDQIGTVGADELGVEGDAEIDGTLSIGTAASTTALRVGSDQISTINGLIFGFCNIPNTEVTATSSSYADCTGATGVTSSYRVFVQATSSLPTGLIVEAASSTATTGTINVRIFNDFASSTPSILNTGAVSLNFWAVR